MSGVIGINNLARPIIDIEGGDENNKARRIAAAFRGDKNNKAQAIYYKREEEVAIPDDVFVVIGRFYRVQSFVESDGAAFVNPLYSTNKGKTWQVFSRASFSAEHEGEIWMKGDWTSKTGSAAGKLSYLFGSPMSEITETKGSLASICNPQEIMLKTAPFDMLFFRGAALKKAKAEMFRGFSGALGKEALARVFYQKTVEEIETGIFDNFTLSDGSTGAFNCAFFSTAKGKVRIATTPPYRLMDLSGLTAPITDVSVFNNMLGDMTRPGTITSDVPVVGDGTAGAFDMLFGKPLSEIYAGTTSNKCFSGGTWENHPHYSAIPANWK